MPPATKKDEYFAVVDIKAFTRALQAGAYTPTASIFQMKNAAPEGSESSSSSCVIYNLKAYNPVSKSYMVIQFILPDSVADKVEILEPYQGKGPMQARVDVAEIPEFMADLNHCLSFWQQDIRARVSNPEGSTADITMQQSKGSDGYLYLKWPWKTSIERLMDEQRQNGGKYIVQLANGYFQPLEQKVGVTLNLSSFLRGGLRKPNIKRKAAEIAPPPVEGETVA